jgi:hypothetical protein
MVRPDRTAYSSRVAETDGIALNVSPTAYPLLSYMSIFGLVNLVSHLTEDHSET